jgi:hypothetical protein
MRLSDARLRRQRAKLIYPDHRPAPWLTEDAISRDRSNRLLDVCVPAERSISFVINRRRVLFKRVWVGDPLHISPDICLGVERSDHGFKDGATTLHLHLAMRLRRGGALPPTEADLSQSSTPPPWLTEDLTPRSLEPIVRSQPLRHFKQRRRIAVYHNQQRAGCARRCTTPLLPILQCTY